MAPACQTDLLSPHHPTSTRTCVTPPIETTRALRIRIEERFPGSGLEKVAEHLESIATHTGERLQRVTRPNVPLRATVVIVTLSVLALPMIVLVLTDLPMTVPDVWELVQAVDAAVHDVIFVGLLLFFLYTLENRIKRRRALHFLRELHALAHIIDMYQLTKDPDRFMGGGSDTPSSPTREMGKYRLGRYLDYCSEMLSLVNKLAALYAQSFDGLATLVFSTKDIGSDTIWLFPLSAGLLFRF